MNVIVVDDIDVDDVDIVVILIEVCGRIRGEKREMGGSSRDGDGEGWIRKERKKERKSSTPRARKVKLYHLNLKLSFANSFSLFF